jgi:hypothetical protein
MTITFEEAAVTFLGYVKDYVKADELGLWPNSKVRTQAKSIVSSNLGDMLITSWTVSKPYGDKNQYSQTVASWQIALKVAYKNGYRSFVVDSVLIKFDPEGADGEKAFLLPLAGISAQELVDNKEKIVATVVQLAQTALNAQLAAQNILNGLHTGKAK